MNDVKDPRRDGRGQVRFDREPNPQKSSARLGRKTTKKLKNASPPGPHRDPCLTLKVNEEKLDRLARLVAGKVWDVAASATTSDFDIERDYAGELAQDLNEDLTKGALGAALNSLIRAGLYEDNYEAALTNLVDSDDDGDEQGEEAA